MFFVQYLRYITAFAVIYFFFVNIVLSQNEYNQLVLQDGYFWNFNNIPMTLTKGFPQILSNFLSSVCDNNGNLMFIVVLRTTCFWFTIRTMKLYSKKRRIKVSGV